MGRIKQLPRRSFLRGAGGIALALPALEIMMPRRRARGADCETPARYLNSYVGTSTGRSHYIDDVCCTELQLSDRITPDQVGANYDVPQALQPIAAAPWQYQTGFGGNQPAYDVQSEITVVSGLKIPWQNGDGSLPPGGRWNFFHGNTVLPQIAGIGYGPNYPTADQLVAEVAGGATLFDSLAYRVEVMDYRAGGGGGDTGAMSWKRDESGTGAIRVDPVVNPGFAWETLVTGFVPPDPAAAEALARELQTRISVLDLVGESASQLRAKLGQTDKIRMEQHLEEIWSLEKRLREIDLSDAAQCAPAPDPGQDWPPGVPSDQTETETNGWSNEELRAEVFTDLIQMAFACDLTRSVTLMFEHWKSWMNMYPAIGRLQDLHAMTHFGGASTGVGPLADSIAWHVKHFARLVRKLKDIQDCDGVPVLDRTVMTMIFEGGYGFDPDSGGTGSHSTENMVVLVAGGRELGLSPGRHIVGEEAHPASVLLAGIRACGVTQSLGEISDPFPGL